MTRKKRIKADKSVLIRFFSRHPRAIHFLKIKPVTIFEYLYHMPHISKKLMGFNLFPKLTT